MAKEVNIFYERLASYLAEKRNQPNSHMMCRLIEGILRDIPHVCVYLHNILVSGKTEEEHIQSLDAILTRLEDAGLRLKQKRCSFMQCG